MRGTFLVGIAALALVACVFVWNRASESRVAVDSIPSQGLPADPKPGGTTPPALRPASRPEPAVDDSSGPSLRREPLTPEIDEATLRRTVETEDPCALIRGNSAGHARIQDVFHVLQTIGDHFRYPEGWTFSSVQVFFEAFSERDPAKALAALDREQADPMAQLWAGLLRANLLSGSPNPHPDYAQALDALARLRRTWPENGALPFFELEARLARGDSEAAVAQATNEAFVASQFRDPSLELRRAVWDAGVRDPKLFALAGNLLDRVPSAQLGKGAKEILARVRPGNDSFLASAGRFGRRWMEDGLSVKGHVPGIYYSPLEYQLGRQIAQRAAELARGGALPTEDEAVLPPLSRFPGALKMVPWGLVIAEDGCRDGDLRQRVKELDEDNTNFWNDRTIPR